MNELERVFLKTVSRENLFPRGSSVCAAVSGGADSVAMMHLLARYSRSRGFQVRVLHVNHKLRSQSDSDQKFVEDMADSLSLPFSAVCPDARCGGSVESRWSAARQSVYNCQEDIVAVGHNAGDRAETVLLRLVEGAGLRGLGGMDYRGRGTVRRPMLDLGRRAIREWLTGQDIPWVEDHTNQDEAMARNRIRLNVLPVLEENFPQAVQGICRSGSILSGWRDLQDQLEELLSGDSIEIDIFRELPEVISSLALWQMAGKPRKGFTEFGKVVKWLKHGGKGSHLLPGGKKLIADSESVRIVEKGSGRY